MPVRNSTDVKTERPHVFQHRDEHDSQWPICSIAWETVVALARAAEEASGLEPSSDRDEQRRQLRSMLAERASLMQPSGVER
jgi:hypothetical protein